VNKKQIETAAKEFCVAEGIDNAMYILDAMTGFLQSMIDKSLIFDLDHVSDLRTEIIALSEENENLKKDYSEIFKDQMELMSNMDFLNEKRESTFSSAGKEVKIGVLVRNCEELSLALKYNDRLGYVSGTGGSINAFIEREFPVVVPIEQSYWLKDDLVKCINLYNVIPIDRLYSKNQFKATPAKEISDQEIEKWAVSDHKIEKGAGLISAQHNQLCIRKRIEGAKWMRDKLTKKEA
jgi:hypothetical protein